MQASQNFNPKTKENQTVIISDRKKVEINGVKSILSLEDDYIKIEYDAGFIYIDGEELKVESLSKEDGRIQVIGNIISLSFDSGKKKKKRGFK